MKYTDAVRLKKNWLLRKIPWTLNFEVMETFIWYIDYKNKNYYVVVPKGFVTNFGSIPRLVRTFFDPVKYLWYVLHDYLYSKEGKIKYDNGLETEINYTRLDADTILYTSIRVEWGWLIESICIFLWVALWWFIKYKKT